MVDTSTLALRDLILSGRRGCPDSDRGAELDLFLRDDRAALGLWFGAGAVNSQTDPARRWCIEAGR